MTNIGTLLLKLEQIYGLEDHINLSLFQRYVYLITLCIPEGYVTTYGAIASLLNSGPRNVGTALRKNPFTGYVEETQKDMIKVPCHRVVSSSGIGGFFGSTSGNMIDKKVELLSSEGINITRGKVDKSQILSESLLLEEVMKMAK